MMCAPEQTRTTSSSDVHGMRGGSWRGRAAVWKLPSDQPRPTPRSVRDSMSRFGRRAIPWLCLLLMASTAAHALQLTADTPSPSAEYDTARGALIEAGAQCIEMGDRIPSNVLGAMKMEELRHLQAALCLATRAAYPATESE
jgi:hypothetical protein